MHEATPDSIPFPAADAATPDLRDLLTQIVTTGARQMLVHAVEAEAAQWIADRQHPVDDDGHRQVVRNGHAAPRTIVTGVGPMQVKMPRVHDRRPPQSKERFTSAILNRAGWHVSKGLRVPANITLQHLPPYSPELNPVERLWAYLRGHYLSNRVFLDYDELFNETATAWNHLDTSLLASITASDWVRRAI
jgi:hypothetical protein